MEGFSTAIDALERTKVLCLGAREQIQGDLELRPRDRREKRWCGGVVLASEIKQRGHLSKITSSVGDLSRNRGDGLKSSISIGHPRRCCKLIGHGSQSLSSTKHRRWKSWSCFSFGGRRCFYLPRWVRTPVAACSVKKYFHQCCWTRGLVRAALQLQTPASRPRSTACVWAADKKAVFSFVGAQRFVVVVGPWMSRRASTATRVRPGPTSPAPPRVREIDRETVFQNSAFSEKFSHRFSGL
jgi:hypothetical protein